MRSAYSVERSARTQPCSPSSLRMAPTIFEMSAGTVNGTVVGQGGGNTYTIDGGVINGSLFAGSGNDMDHNCRQCGDKREPGSE